VRETKRREVKNLLNEHFPEVYSDLFVSISSLLGFGQFLRYN